MSTIYTTYTDAYSAWGYKKGKECCPKCGRKLITKQSGIYDSCYDIKLRPKKHYWRPISICDSCGKEDRGGYKGVLSEEEFLKQKELTIR